MIPKEGFEAILQNLESYLVNTEDGYILTLFRVVPEKDNVTCYERYLKTWDGDPKPVVLLGHGFPNSGVNWLLNNPGKTLPSMLVAEGYDCWLCCFRGTIFSQAHVSLTTKSKEYWDFSIHEMAIYDLAAIIDRILEITGNEKMYYIGFSIGAAIPFALLSTKPQYNDKLKLMISLAPPIYPRNMRGIAFYTAIPYFVLLSNFKCAYRRQFTSKSFSQMGKSLLPCSKDPAKIGYWLFQITMKAFHMNGPLEEVEVERRKLIAQFLLSPTSNKVACHVGQIYFSKRFRPFDHGKKRNFEKYGKEKVWDYDIKSVTTPVLLFSGKSDGSCTVEGVTALAKDILHLVDHRVVPEPSFSHSSFVFSKDAHIFIYSPIIECLNSIEAGNYRVQTRSQSLCLVD